MVCMKKIFLMKVFLLGSVVFQIQASLQCSAKKRRVAKSVDQFKEIKFDFSDKRITRQEALKKTTGLLKQIERFQMEKKLDSKPRSLELEKTKNNLIQLIKKYNLLDKKLSKVML